MTHSTHTPQVNARYIAASGDTRYTITGMSALNRGAAIVRVEIRWPSGWHITNRHASFRLSHIAEMVESGRWDEDPTVTTDYVLDL